MITKKTTINLTTKTKVINKKQLLTEEVAFYYLSGTIKGIPK